MDNKIILVLVMCVFLFSCTSSHNLNENKEIDIEKKEVTENIKEQERFYEKNIDGNTLILGPVLSKGENENLVLRVDETGVFKKEGESWIDYEDIVSVRDRGSQKYDLFKGKEYQIKNGLLNTKFQNNLFYYDYNLLVSYNQEWTFVKKNVFLKLKKGSYYKGTDFIEFATIDTIYCNDIDLSIFNNTDIEIDFEFDSDEIYEGILSYIREDKRSTTWTRDNFRFDLK